jgi:hypothetical protein
MATEDDELEYDGGAPPEADVVALRTLAVASLLRRLELEKRKAKPPEFAALLAWVEDNGLYASFGESGMELFDAEPNSWDAEAKEAVEWAAEELLMLAWSLGKSDPPPLFTRADATALLAALPSSGDVQSASLAASLRAEKDLDALLALYETLANAGRLEAWARGIAADSTLADGDDELEGLLSAMAASGFPREQLTQEKGAAGAAIEALRAQSRALIADLFADKSPHLAYAFAPDRLASLDEEALAVFIATAQIRGEALIWLREGDEEDPGED